MKFPWLSILPLIFTVPAFAGDPPNTSAKSSAKASAKVGGCDITPDFKRVLIAPSFCEFRGKIDGTSVTYFRARGKVAPLVIIHRSMLMERLSQGVEELFAARLASQGFHSLIIEHVIDLYDLERPPSEAGLFFASSLHLSHSALDLAEGWREVRPEFYSLGSSLGGMNGLIAYAADPRIRRIVSAVSGGDLASILANTEQPFLADYRKQWMAKLGLASAAAYEAYVRRVLPLDPLQAANRGRPEDVMLFLATQDTVVPYTNQRSLLAALGNPRHSSVRGQHPAGGAAPLWQIPEIARFFRGEK